MKLLIVSSEPLHPEDTFSSTFELSQAQLLSRIGQTAILSVGERPGLRTRLKGGVMGMRRVRRHEIEGVRVYEGLAPPATSDFMTNLGAWTDAVEAAFRVHCRFEGKPDVIHAHGRFLSAGAFALRIRRRLGIPFIYTDHSTFYQRGCAPLEARSVLRQIIDEASVYSVVSPALAKAVESFLGLPAPTARILPNALDPMFEAKPLHPTDKAGPFVFINLATLTPVKGLDLLIQAFARAFRGRPAYQLQICGEGPLREGLEKLAENLGIKSQLQMPGKLSKAEVLRRVDQAHVLVVASLVETFGVAITEGLARGRPVIATRCGGPDDIVGIDCGVLVPTGDVGALAEAMQAMAADYSRYDSVAIRKSALTTYGAAAFLERMADFCRLALR
jgi:glycosyltransferase involved in cell wall biosynthesis